jgi:hypothetical protein
MGDCIVGSGEVPQDEFGPLLEFDEADGELYEVLWPVLILPSALDLDPFVLALFPKKSYSGLFPTLSRIEGLKSPERLDISPLSSKAGVLVNPTLETECTGDANCWL